MTKGKLLPTLEEMQKDGHGHLHIKLHIGKATVGGEEADISYSPTGVFVDYRGRSVLFDLKDLVVEATGIIDKKLTQENIARKIEVQKGERE